MRLRNRDWKRLKHSASVARVKPRPTSNGCQPVSSTEQLKRDIYTHSKLYVHWAHMPEMPTRELIEF